MFRVKVLMVFALVATLALCSSMLTTSLADGGANHQVRNQHFGVSGGNVNDHSSAFCCSGTLGSLVKIGTTQYVLSNNHVLGRSGAAAAGEDISQPGLIDNGCRVATLVADFTAAAPLGSSNVDAAIAQLRPGTMDSSGFIEDIGVPSSTTVNPSVGMSVAKSGRTTGFTTGTVSSINTSVSVQYQQGCNQGKKFTVSYTNQVVINSSTFSAGGDSGSLIVTNNASHNPVALLFAGSSTTTIGNPINEVLTKLSAALGNTVTFNGVVSTGGGGGHRATTQDDGEMGSGGRQPFTPGIQSLMPQLPQQAIDRATAVLENHRANLMFQPAVMGVGVGASGRADGEAAIVVYVNKDAGNAPFLPDSIEGIPVTVILTDQFIAR
jgi:Peptidase family S64